jgi:hypothetical protein
VVRIEVAVRQPTALPGPRCGWSELGLRTHGASPPRRPTPMARSEGGGGAHPPGCLLGCRHHRPLPQQPELHSLSYYAVGDEVPLGARFVRTLLRQLAQELLKAIRFNFACL